MSEGIKYEFTEGPVFTTNTYIGVFSGIRGFKVE
jgi:hypothetical protein